MSIAARRTFISSASGQMLLSVASTSEIALTHFNSGRCLHRKPLHSVRNKPVSIATTPLARSDRKPTQMKDKRQRLIQVPVKMLEVGVQSHGRIFDLRGRLLLSDGATLTEEMKASLAERGIGEVLMTPVAKTGSDDEFDEAATAKRVLDQLDRKSSGWGKSRRRPRRRFQSNFAIRMINVEPATTLRIWARNISEQGLGFIHRGEIKGNRFIVQFGKAALEAEIVRRRPVSEGFWEYGATFSARLDQRRSDRQHAVGISPSNELSQPLPSERQFVS